MHKWIGQRVFCTFDKLFCFSSHVYFASLLLDQGSCVLWNNAKWVKSYLQPPSLLVSHYDKYLPSNVGPIVVSFWMFVEASCEVAKGSISHAHK